MKIRLLGSRVIELPELRAGFKARLNWILQRILELDQLATSGGGEPGRNQAYLRGHRDAIQALFDRLGDY